MKYILYIVALIFLFQSCLLTTTYIGKDITIRKPSYLTFSEELKNIILVDNSPVNIEGLELKADSILNNEKNNIALADSAKYYTLSLLQQYMSEEKIFDTIILYPKNLNNTNIVKALDKEEISRICTENNADLLISFDLMAVTQINSEWSIPSIYLSARTNFYKKDGEQSIRPILFLHSIYPLSKKLRKQMVSNTYEVKNSFSNELNFWSDKMAIDLVPSWETQGRIYYVYPSKKMNQADKLANKDNWAEAANIWNELYEKEKDVTKKMMLAFNIATANEFLDDIPYAYDWINVAYGMMQYNDKSDLAYRIQSYRAKLSNRVKEMPTLIRQLRVEDTDTLEAE